jgi:glycosyltransferase involved in cell wall biosynthesis
MKANEALNVLIVHFGTASDIGGTDERVFQIANELAKQGVEVTLSAEKVLRSDNVIDGRLHFIEPTKKKLSFYDNLRWYVKLISSSLKERYDVVQIESCSFKRTLALFFLLRPLSRRLVVVFHDKFFQDDPQTSIKGRMDLFILQLLLCLCDASITPGLEVKKYFETLQGDLAKKKMLVIPNGAPTFAPKENINIKNLRRIYGLPSDAFVALFFGSMTFKPNFEAAMHLYNQSDYLVTEFEKQTGKKLIFAIAGVGSEGLPRTENYLPLGFVKDFGDLLSLPDLIVLPHDSCYSGPHVKTIYAFLSKKPVVATEDAVKDMPHIVANHHFLQFDVSRPENLLFCLRKLYSDKKLGEYLAFNAYNYTQQYSWKQMAANHRRLYKALLYSN